MTSTRSPLIDTTSCRANVPGESLKKALADFFFSFKGIKGCSSDTAAAATMIHAAAASQGLNLQVRQSLIAGIGLLPEEKEKVASLAAAIGTLPLRLLLSVQLEEIEKEEWTGLLQIAVALTCFDPNQEQQFEKARTTLFDSSLGNFNKPSEVLAHVLKLHQEATTAFGKEFITQYDLFQLIRKKPREVQFEVDSALADGDSASHLNCDWLFIEDTVTKAWTKCSRRPNGYYDGILQLLDPNHPKQSPANAPTMHAALHPSAHDSLEDKKLVCERLNEDVTTCGTRSYSTQLNSSDSIS